MLTATELIAGLESGRIPVGFLYRHRSGETFTWQWYEPGTPGRWHGEDTFEACCQKLLERSRHD